ncbi:hypothetical protein [Vibrio chaetopteri]|uniref:Uncharacterized protein n=1 Tax=Vibrio chaetopteri TaxID=3016528 RepID=A0AAU8BRY2_9VIBR
MKLEPDKSMAYRALLKDAHKRIMLSVAGCVSVPIVLIELDAVIQQLDPLGEIGRPGGEFKLIIMLFPIVCSYMAILAYLEAKHLRKKLDEGSTHKPLASASSSELARLRMWSRHFSFVREFEMRCRAVNALVTSTDVNNAKRAVQKHLCMPDDGKR